MNVGCDDREDDRGLHRNHIMLIPRGRIAALNSPPSDVKPINHSLTVRGHANSETIQRLRRAMRNNWIMTRLETAIFITGVTLLAGGAVWAAAIG
jgi:hypothetical protein